MVLGKMGIPLLQASCLRLCPEIQKNAVRVEVEEGSSSVETKPGSPRSEPSTPGRL